LVETWDSTGARSRQYSRRRCRVADEKRFRDCVSWGAIQQNPGEFARSWGRRRRQKRPGLIRLSLDLLKAAIFQCKQTFSVKPDSGEKDPFSIWASRLQDFEQPFHFTKSLGLAAGLWHSEWALLCFLGRTPRVPGTFGIHDLALRSPTKNRFFFQIPQGSGTTIGPCEKRCG